MRALILCTLTGCSTIAGSGVMGTETFDVSGAVSVTNQTFMDVLVREGDADGEVRCDDNLLEYLDIRVRDNELLIDMQDGHKYKPQLDCAVAVTVERLESVTNEASGDVIAPESYPSLSNIALSGSGLLDVRTAGGADLKVRSSSSGELTLSTAEGAASINASGSGPVSVSSVAGKLTITMSGSGTISVSELSGNIDIENTGSGLVEVLQVLGTNGSMQSTSSGGMRLTGILDSYSMRSSGSGEMDGRYLAAKTIEVDSSSSGDLYVLSETDGEVTGELSGSGDLYIYGRPSVSVDQRGSGSVIIE